VPVARSITLAGVTVTEDEARNIVTTLVTDDTPPALELANRITTCLELNMRHVSLDAFERSTLLAVLEDPPDSLVELRGALARDDPDRQ
jgi:hypothetical protein